MALRVVVLLSATLLCHAVSIEDQLHHIARRRQENGGLGGFRRMYGVDDTSSILGAPRYPNQLPEAEPILPGHTLLRPTLGMLKSAIKFPHREMANGAGVYGNTNNILGIRWDGTSERLSYSGFRRSPSNFLEIIPGRAIGSEENILITNHAAPHLGRKIRVVRDYRQSNPVREENEWEAQLKEHIYGDQNGDLTRQTEKKANLLASRLFSSPETLNFVKLMIQKLKEVKRPRRQASIVVLKPLGGETVGEDLGYGYNADQEYDDDELDIGALEAAKNVSAKTKWFWDSKNAYNHIKFNSDAPDHEDHFPANAKDFEDEEKKWWYFHQSDFQPFTELEN